MWERNDPVYMHYPFSHRWILWDDDSGVRNLLWIPFWGRVWRKKIRWPAGQKGERGDERGIGHDDWFVAMQTNTEYHLFPLRNITTTTPRRHVRTKEFVADCSGIRLGLGAPSRLFISPFRQSSAQQHQYETFRFAYWLWCCDFPKSDHDSSPTAPIPIS